MTCSDHKGNFGEDLLVVIDFKVRVGGKEDIKRKRKKGKDEEGEFDGGF